MKPIAAIVNTIIFPVDKRPVCFNTGFIEIPIAAKQIPIPPIAPQSPNFELAISGIIH